jgi:hypothetical protein
MALMVEQGEIDPEFAFVANMTQAQTDQAMVGLIPIVRIESGKYLIGTEIKSMQIKNESLLVRVGGGYATLQDHLSKCARQECLKLQNLMKKKNLDYKEAVCSLIGN